MERKTEQPVHAYADIFIVALLSSRGNEDLLLMFINAVLIKAGIPLVTKVTIQSPFHFRKYTKDKLAIMDVLALDEHGREFIIEIQASDNPHFIQRVIYYTGRTIADQLKKGQSYDVLKPTISINIVNFTLFKSLINFYNAAYFTLQNVPDVILTDLVSLHFIELPKIITKDPYELDTLGRFAWWLLNAEKGKNKDMEILLKTEPLIKKSHEFYQKFTANPKRRDAIRRRDNRDIDIDTRIAGAKVLAELEGIEKGREAGMEEVATKLLSMSMDIEQIVKITNLTAEHILTLKNSGS